MEPEKEKWINDVLRIADGIERADPSPFLYAKIRHRLFEAAPRVYLPARTVWLTATSFALLLLLNWRVVSQQVSPADADEVELSTVVSEMQLYPATNQPYSLWSEQNY
ncbi:hypothetical protein IC229_17725 [Spirosoma sp. BT702]|uniref:Uncharacterized protein n=1 Tax=Spirosoma profusum TaxID=2771354 RepID=A0A927AU52_9BACT|nr:hypothetical protein [Spirosoma profusum]MBD2702492.1 hypothetical protein [Spirosoma profusum]